MELNTMLNTANSMYMYLFDKKLWNCKMEILHQDILMYDLSLFGKGVTEQVLIG